jgi:hypothetical protein
VTIGRKAIHRIALQLCAPIAKLDCFMTPVFFFRQVHSHENSGLQMSDAEIEVIQNTFHRIVSFWLSSQSEVDSRLQLELHENNDQDVHFHYFHFKILESHTHTHTHMTCS